MGFPLFLVFLCALCAGLARAWFFEGFCAAPAFPNPWAVQLTPHIDITIAKPLGKYLVPKFFIKHLFFERYFERWGKNGKNPQNHAGRDIQPSHNNTSSAIAAFKLNSKNKIAGVVMDELYKKKAHQRGVPQHSAEGQRVKRE